jgi:iron complex outermembrane receptor protein
MEELLTHLVGVDVMQRGGHGVQSDVSIRGGSADQTAILLDGINVTNPHTGHYSFDIPLNLSDIERIEVLRGPSALVYGSGSFGGGINIITRKSSPTPLRISTEAGTHALASGELFGELKSSAVTSSLSGGYRRSDGYRANSEYGLLDLLSRTRLTLSDSATLDFKLGYNHKQYGANTFYSALYPNQYDRRSSILSTLQGVFGHRFKLIPMLYWQRHLNRFDLIRDSDVGRNHHLSDVYGGHLIFHYPTLLGLTALAVDLRRESIVSSNLGVPLSHPNGIYTHHDSRSTKSLTLEHTVTYRRFTGSAGFLLSHNTLEDNFQLYPSLAIAYSPTRSTRLYASWGRSGRLPTFTDLYYTTATHIADERLRAERSESIDVGASWGNAVISINITGYLMNGTDIIDWVRGSGEERWSSWNLTSLRKFGFESGVTARVGRYCPALGKSTALSLNYGWMDQACDSRGLESRYSLNYIRNKLTLSLSHPIYDSLTMNWRFRYQHRMGEFRRYADGIDMGLSAFPAFSVLDLRLNYLTGHWQFHIDVTNVYNVDYYDIGNVPQAGIWLFGGISFAL